MAGVHPGHTPYLNLSDWAPGMVMGRPSALYEESYPTGVPDNWPRGESTFPSRWVWAHTEFTPRQTMRGKMALYGYLHGLESESSTTGIFSDGFESGDTVGWSVVQP